MDQHESLQRGEELPLNISLAHYVTNAPASGVLIVDPKCCSISKSGEMRSGKLFTPVSGSNSHAAVSPWHDL